MSSVASGRALAAGRSADDAAQAAADLANPFGERRVGESPSAMLVGDRTAGEVDAVDRETVGGTLGEVGRDQRRFGGKRTGAAVTPALPLAPWPVVHGAGGLGTGCGDGFGDPDGLLDTQANGQVGVVRRRQQE